VFEGVPAVCLDGLGSASYGPEAMPTRLFIIPLLVPWQFEPPKTKPVLAEEEPQPP